MGQKLIYYSRGSHALQTQFRVSEDDTQHKQHTAWHTMPWYGIAHCMGERANERNENDENACRYKSLSPASVASCARLFFSRSCILLRIFFFSFRFVVVWLFCRSVAANIFKIPFRHIFVVVYYSEDF